MEDVIFNGSEQRGASSKAQVSILFDRGDGVFPGIYEQQQQLQITRTLKRTGSSQYAINNVRVRLRDIHELFLDTGVHNQRYSFIEQGQIGDRECPARKHSFAFEGPEYPDLRFAEKVPKKNAPNVCKSGSIIAAKRLRASKSLEDWFRLQCVIVDKLSPKAAQDCH